MRTALLIILSLTLIHCIPQTTASGFSVGSQAHAYLAADTYTSVLIEIQPVSGFAPNSTTISNLIAFLQARLNKPVGITYVIDTPIVSPGGGAYSLTDVINIESANRQHYSSGTQLVAYYLFLDGHSSSDTANGQILGEAYSGDAIAMFENTMMGLSGGLGQPNRVTLESTVSEHEFGHLLGLTNVGTSMTAAHQDVAHGAHCTQTSCLMYWEVETSSSVANLLGGSVPTLDADCIADLRANGGK